jgi:hypothetical protein
VDVGGDKKLRNGPDWLLLGGSRIVGPWAEKYGTQWYPRGRDTRRLEEGNARPW